MPEKVTFAWEGGTVSGAWHRPVEAAAPAAALVLAHGAGGTMHSPAMVAVAEALAARGLAVVRFNFPYAEARRRVPDRQAQLVACYQAVAEQVRAQAARVYLGGRSMGGRIASHVVADGFSAAGLVLLSYPLHPPRQPHRLRTAHLAKVTAPMLFVQGSRDAFARPDLLRATLDSLPTATLHLVEGADHGLRVSGRAPGDVVEEIVEAMLRWMDRQT